MALEENALTTEDEINAELGISGQTTLVERLINVASAQIQSVVGRKLFRTDGIVEKRPGHSSPFLRLDRTPILSLTSVTFLGDSVSLDDIEIHDPDAGILCRQSGWSWTVAVHQEITQTPIPGTERKSYEFTYNGGFVTPEQTPSPFATRTLPFDLEDACIKLVTSRFLKKGSDLDITSEKLKKWSASYAGASGTGSEGGIPPPILRMLDRHRRVVIA